MGRGCTAALAAAAAAAAALLVSLPMLLVSLPKLLVSSLPAADPYEQETRWMFVAWKAKYGMAYRYAGEEECRYAVFKNTRRFVARHRAAGVMSSGLNGLSDLAIEEVTRGRGVRKGESSFEEETRRNFARWKAKYGKAYRDAGEEECRYRLFKGNRRRFVVRLNATATATASGAAWRNVYGLNQFGDLTEEEVRERCYQEQGVEEDGELSARCQAATHDPDLRHGRPMIRYQVCRCIATELKETESGNANVWMMYWNRNGR